MAEVIDLLIHIFLLTVGLRLFVRVRLYRAVLIVALGAISYTAIQALIATIYTSFDIIDSSSFNDGNSWGSRALQLTTQSVCYAVAYTVMAFDLGITKWARPPHELYIGTSLSKDRKAVLIASFLLIMFLSLGVYILIHSDILAAAALISALLIAVIMYTYRRDAKNERRNHDNIKSRSNIDS